MVKVSRVPYVTIDASINSQVKVSYLLCSLCDITTTNDIESVLKVEYSEATFEKLIVENQRMIRKICSIYASSEADQEDLFQEITIQLWRSFHSFQGKSRFSTWLYRVALNTAITQKRKKDRQPTLDSLSGEEMRIPQTEEDGSEEDIRELRAAIRKLKAVDRAIIFLYLEEKSYQEIADIIGITPKNVGVKIVRIKARLLGIIKSSHGR